MWSNIKHFGQQKVITKSLTVHSSISHNITLKHDKFKRKNNTSKSICTEANTKYGVSTTNLSFFRTYELSQPHKKLISSVPYELLIDFKLFSFFLAFVSSFLIIDCLSFLSKFSFFQSLFFFSFFHYFFFFLSFFYSNFLQLFLSFFVGVKFHYANYFCRTLCFLLH